MDVENQWKLVKIMELQCFFPLVLGMVVFFFILVILGFPQRCPVPTEAVKKAPRTPRPMSIFANLGSAKTMPKLRN